MHKNNLTIDFNNICDNNNDLLKIKIKENIKKEKKNY